MRKLTNLLPILFITIFFSCGNEKSKSDKLKEQFEVKQPTSLAEAEANWKDYHGVGPVSELTLPSEINQEMSTKGQEIFEAKCTACHKIEKKIHWPFS